MEHFEVEPSQEIIDDDMDFGGKNDTKLQSRSRHNQKQA